MLISLVMRTGIIRTHGVTVQFEPRLFGEPPETFKTILKLTNIEWNLLRHTGPTDWFVIIFAETARLPISVIASHTPFGIQYRGLYPFHFFDKQKGHGL